MSCTGPLIDSTDGHFGGRRVRRIMEESFANNISEIAEIFERKNP